MNATEYYQQLELLTQQETDNKKAHGAFIEAETTKHRSTVRFETERYEKVLREEREEYRAKQETLREKKHKLRMQYLADNPQVGGNVATIYVATK